MTPPHAGSSGWPPAPLACVVFALIARTGTRWPDSTGQIANCHWKLITGPGVSGEPEPFALLHRTGFQPVRESGEPDSWANWHGTVQSLRPCLLRTTNSSEITHRENHGGIAALWIQPVGPLNGARLDVQVAAGTPGDLYARDVSTLHDTSGVLEFPGGEEPVLIEIPRFRRLTDNGRPARPPPSPRAAPASVRAAASPAPR